MYRLLWTLKIIHSKFFGTEKGWKQAIRNPCSFIPCCPSYPLSSPPPEASLSLGHVHSPREGSTRIILWLLKRCVLSNCWLTKGAHRIEQGMRLWKKSVHPGESGKGEKRANTSTWCDGKKGCSNSHSFLLCFQHSRHPQNFCLWPMWLYIYIS